jgi:hypothetical protein
MTIIVLDIKGGNLANHQAGKPELGVKFPSTKDETLFRSRNDDPKQSFTVDTLFIDWF